MDSIQKKDQTGCDSSLMSNTCNFYSSKLQTKPFEINNIDSFISYKALDQYHENTDLVFIKNIKYLTPSAAYEQFIGFMRPALNNPYGLGTTSVKQACSARIGDFTALHCPLNNHEVIAPNYAYIGDYNPLKGDHSVRSSASKLVNKLTYLKDKDNNAKGGYLIGIDLTFPKEVSEQLLNPGKRDKVLHKAALCMKDLIQYMRSLYCIDRDSEDIGLFYNLHLWKSENPLKPHLHYHVNLLNFVSKKEIVKSVQPTEEYNPYTQKLNKTIVVKKEDTRFSMAYRLNADGNREEVNVLNALKRFNPRLDHRQIKQKWAEIVNKHFRLSYDKLDVYLHYNLLKNRTAIMHRIKYCSRKPLMDLFEYYTENSFNPEAVNKDFTDFVMRYDNRRTAIGFARMLNRLVVAPDIKRACPICGNAAQVVDHYSFEDLNAKLLSGSCAFIQWDHKAKEYEIIRSKRRLKEIMTSLGGGG